MNTELSDMLENLEPNKNEDEVNYWKRINSLDKNDIGLYCQSCCFHYPETCIYLNTLHPYDRTAEACADFVPKDMYKPLSKAKCWKKRLEIEPNYRPLPDCELRHPIQWYAFVPSESYYKIMTKLKILNYVFYKKHWRY